MYRINETVPHQELLRTFFCPPQLKVFALRDPPLFDMNRCSRHAIDCVDDGKYCCQQLAQRLRVGECPRCFQEARQKIRPEYEAKVNEIQEKMNGITDDYQKKLEDLVKQNEELQKKLYQTYLKYEKSIQDHVKEAKAKEAELKTSCCCSRKQCRH